MVSAITGGLAKGFIQGMDVRAARESTAAAIAARKEEARLGREHTANLQTERLTHEENLYKNKVKDDKKKQEQVLASQAFTALSNFGSKSGRKVISQDTLPLVLVDALKSQFGFFSVNKQGDKDPNGQFFLNPQKSIFDANQQNTIMASLDKGNISYKTAIGGGNGEAIKQELVKRFRANNPQYKNKKVDDATLSTYYNRRYNKSNAKTVLVNISRMNASDPIYTYRPLYLDDGSVHQSDTLKVPKNKKIALQLLGLTANTKEIERLSTSGILLDLAHLTYLNNLFSDIKYTLSNNPQDKASKAKKRALEKILLKNSNKEIYLKLLATKGKFEAQDPKRDQGTSSYYTNFKKMFKNLHVLYSNNASNPAKIISQVNSMPSNEKDKVSFTDIKRDIIADPSNKIDSAYLFDVAYSLGFIKIERSKITSGVNQDASSLTAASSQSNDANLNDAERGPLVVERQGSELGFITKVTIDKTYSGQEKNVTYTLGNVDTTKILINANEGVDTQGGEKIFVSSRETLPNNKEFIAAISMDVNRKHSPEHFELQMKNDPKFKRNYDYFSSKGLYKLIQKVSTTGNEQDYEKLFKLMDELFEFKGSGKEKRTEMHEAIDFVVEQIYKLSAQRGHTPIVNTVSNTEVIAYPKLIYRAEPSEADKRRQKALEIQANKIAIVTSQIEKTEETIDKMGLIAIAKLMPGIANTQNQDKLHGIYNLALGDARVDLKNEDVRKLLGIKTQDVDELHQIQKVLRNEGYKKSTEMLQATHKLFQVITDIATASRVVGDKLKDLAGFSTKMLWGKPETLRNNASLTSTAFFSDHDSARDGMTKSRLRQIELLRKNSREGYRSEMTRLNTELGSYGNLGTPWKDLNIEQKKIRLEIQGKIANAYLKAKQTALKISLTYYFAGLVQGESGGRAISNEDFAILFRALWAGGVGGPMIKGGFAVIRDVMTSLATRNRTLQEYNQWGRGTELGTKMIRLRKLRDRFETSYNPVKAALLRQIKNDVPIKGMPGTAAYIPPKHSGNILLPSRATIRKGGNKAKLQGHYNSIIRPILDNTKIGDANSIYAFPAKSWDKLDKSDKQAIDRAIVEGLMNVLNKFPSKTVTILDAFKYDKIGVGTALQTFSTYTKSDNKSVRRPMAAINVLKKFTEDIFNSTRGRII